MAKLSIVTVPYISRLTTKELGFVDVSDIGWVGKTLMAYMQLSQIVPMGNEKTVLPTMLFPIGKSFIAKLKEDKVDVLSFKERALVFSYKKDTKVIYLMILPHDKLDVALDQANDIYNTISPVNRGGIQLIQTSMASNFIMAFIYADSAVTEHQQ